MMDIGSLAVIISLFILSYKGLDSVCLETCAFISLLVKLIFERSLQPIQLLQLVLYLIHVDIHVKVTTCPICQWRFPFRSSIFLYRVTMSEEVGLIGRQQGSVGGRRPRRWPGDEMGKACGDRCDCKTDPDTSRCPGAEGPRAAAEPPSRGM